MRDEKCYGCPDEKWCDQDPEQCDNGVAPENWECFFGVDPECYGCPYVEWCDEDRAQCNDPRSEEVMEDDWTGEGFCFHYTLSEPIEITIPQGFANADKRSIYAWARREFGNSSDMFFRNRKLWRRDYIAVPEETEDHPPIVIETSKAWRGAAADIPPIFYRGKSAKNFPFRKIWQWARKKYPHANLCFRGHKLYYKV